MANGSGLASFQFISYKIDNVNFQVVKNVVVLASNPILQPYEINFNIGIRNSEKYLFNDIIHYVGGLDIYIEILDRQKMQIARGTFGIAGLFCLNNSMEQQEEKYMVQINIPTILLPYLRSTITTVISQAGFGTIVLPLINIHEIAEKQTVAIIDHTNNDFPADVMDHDENS
jgi:preprotein translocase subunit SecB